MKNPDKPRGGMSILALMFWSGVGVLLFQNLIMPVIERLVRYLVNKNRKER